MKIKMFAVWYVLLLVMSTGFAPAKPFVFSKKVIVDNDNNSTLDQTHPARAMTAAPRGPKMAAQFLDSSRNQFGLISSVTEPCVMQNDTLLIVIRQYPTSSGRIAAIQSGDFGASWTIEYDVNAPSTTCRYPSCFGGESFYWCASQFGVGGVAGEMLDLGWGLWDAMVMIYPDSNSYQVLGRQMSNGNTIFFHQGFGNVYKTLRSSDLLTAIIAQDVVWDSTTAEAALIGVDYRAGRFMAMASTKWFSAFQYVMSDDDGATGLTAADTIGFNLSGLADSVIMDSRFVAGSGGSPVMILAVTAKAETLDASWTGAYMYNTIICARPDGSHCTIWDPSGFQGGAAYVYLARGQADTLVACWMMCDYVAGYTSGLTDWDLMFSLSGNGGTTWSCPLKMPEVATGMAECFPHLAMQIGSDQAVHCLFITNGSTTTNYDIYYDAYSGAGTASTTYNYHVAIPLPPPGVEGEQAQIPPKPFALFPSRPNPARDEAAISFTLPRASEYSLSIYDLTGRLVKSFSGQGQAGNNTVNWRLSGGGQAANGIYFYQLKAGGSTAIRKLIVLR